MTAITGGCLCGHIRLTATAEPTNAHFCTCRQCQRWSGAPAVAWADLPAASVRFDGPGGEPAWFRSSDRGERAFCPSCGGTVAARYDGSGVLEITVATLDDPDATVPLFQTNVESAPSWLRLGVMPRRAPD